MNRNLDVGEPPTMSQALDIFESVMNLEIETGLFGQMAIIL
jgi:hypothetical protein